MRRRLLTAALLGACLAAPALADVTVRYRPVLPAGAPAGAAENLPALTVAADDAGQARIEMAAPGSGPGPRPSVALITREGVGYLALNGPGPGMQIVARQDDALALFTQIAAPLLQGAAREGVQQVMRQRVEIVPVGPETVAGVQGNLYRIVIVNGETRAPPIEMVVATDPRLAPVGRELVRLVESMRPTVVAVVGGEPQVFAALKGMLGLGAPLRIGDQMRIDLVSTDDLPDSRFALPGPVMTRAQLQQMATMMMSGMMQGRGAQAPGAPGTPVPTPPSAPAAPATPATPSGDAANPQ